MKASFTSFRMLSLLKSVGNSTCKLDISESIQCTSQQNYNTSLHYNNTNHMSTTIKVVADKENETMQWKKEIRTTLEEIRKQHPQNEFRTSIVIPFLPKSGHLGPSFSSKPLTWWSAPCGMGDNRQHPLSNRRPHPIVLCAVDSIIGLLRKCAMNCTKPEPLFLWLYGSGERGWGKLLRFVWLGLRIWQRV